MPPESGISGGSQVGPVAPLLWSAFGHPRREVRWRAAHSARELLSQEDQLSATRLASTLIGYLDQPDLGPYRDSGLYFYELSAAAAMLAALARVAADRPEVLAGQIPALVRHATSRELPHAQIRELARQAAVAAANPGTRIPEGLSLANQPVACLTSRKRRHHRDRRVDSEEHRYQFDQMDTIPYWYTPLARVFDILSILSPNLPRGGSSTSGAYPRTTGGKTPANCATSGHGPGQATGTGRSRRRRACASTWNSMP